MKVLFIGGTGNISSACARLALARGFDLTLLNRSRRDPIQGAERLTADIGEPAAAEAALEGRSWDAVVDFIAFTPGQLEERLRLFRGRTGQFVFISSASAYRKPLPPGPVTESTPLANPYWEYSRNKIACEERLWRAFREEGFPATVVRPSHTYGDTGIPLALDARGYRNYTGVDRMRRGLPLIVPGDGLSLWTLTHVSDFAKGLVGLLGRRDALGEAFHITSGEALTWDEITRTIAGAAGAPEPRLVHIASEFIAACLPETTGGLLGDKSHSAVFDNAKIRRFVPDFACTVPFREGIARTIRWFDADPARREIDEATNAAWDRLIAAYERGLSAARREFGI